MLDIIVDNIFGWAIVAIITNCHSALNLSLIHKFKNQFL